jgi:hypothetical protein
MQKNPGSLPFLWGPGFSVEGSKLLLILIKEIDVYRRAVKEKDDTDRRDYPTYSNGIHYFPRNHNSGVWTPRVQNGILHRQKVSPLRYRRRKSVALRPYRPIRETTEKDKMTLREYINILTEFIKLHPDAEEMRVSDTYDDDPCDLEIIDNTVVLAEEF